VDLKLTGKVALVTGGANGVGRAICLALAAEGAVVVAQAVVVEIRSKGGKAVAIGADVSQLDQVKTMIAKAAGEFGRLDILVNNAGVALRRRFAETTPEDWRRQIDTCLYGAIHCCHEVAVHLERSGSGRVVSLIGDSSRVGESGLSIVAAARSGVIGLTKSLAREMGHSSVTANVISLGLVETAHDHDWVEANRDKLVRLYPLRRLGQPEDVAPLVALLASEHGGWITGQVISINGGYSMV
jgi:NAD(P)-dependent dehydrogenase (short-subunit alcohol dehydrogenase family)